ncbi:MAG: S8 family serine peptidase [Candidatus Aenigmatarchaeota archaeon]
MAFSSTYFAKIIEFDSITKNVEILNLSDIVRSEEFYLDGYIIKPIIQNETISILLKDSKGTLFSRYMFRDLRSGVFSVLDSEGNKKDYYLNVDTNLSLSQANEESYIIKFKDPPIAVKEEELKREMKVKLENLKDMKGEMKIINNKKMKELEEEMKAIIEVRKKGLEDEMKEKLVNHRNKIEIVHDSFKNEMKKIKKTEKNEIKEFKNVFNGVSLNLSEDKLNDIRKLSYVDKIYKDEKVQLFLSESVDQINATNVWTLLDENSRNLTGFNITIAIIDSGIDYTHTDFGNCTQSQFLSQQCGKVVGGYDFVNFDSDPMDDHGHGTHVAGTAAGNGTLKGVAPEAKILAFKVVDSYGYGQDSSIISAIDAAVESNADVISMSLGKSGGNPNDPLSQAVDNAVNSSVIVVVAAGNSGPGYGTIGTPANALGAITVGAVNKSSIMADFSSRGPVLWNYTAILKPNLVSPGVEICSAEFGSSYSSEQCIDDEHVSMSGTSMSTPHVAGVVALLKQKYNNWTVEEIKSALLTSANDLGYNVITQGTGLVDALKAVNTSVLIEPFIVNVSVIGSATPVTNTTIIIRNLRNYQISINLTIENATDEYQGNYNISYSNATDFTIEANSQSAIIFTTNMTNQGGLFFGKIKINAEGSNYTLPYIVSSLRNLNVSVVGEGMVLYPDLYIHTDDIKGRSQAYQSVDFIGSNFTFLIPANKNITVYAVGDIVNASLTYILMKRVNASFDDSNVTLNFSSDSRTFTINATGLDGSDIKLYEYNFGFATYRNNTDPIKILYSYSMMYDYKIGNQVIYVSNKPDSPYNTDIILKYVGIPVTT